jgi:hypothetical protein
MTEQEWKTSTDPGAMLHFLQQRGGVSARKMRLFACACCRLVWHLLVDERSRAAVEAAELLAEGLLAAEMQEEAFREASAALRNLYRSPPALSETTLQFRRRRNPDELRRAAFLAMFAAGSSAGNIDVYAQGQDVGPNLPDAPARAQLLRCIFGPPTWGLAPGPAGRSPNVVALARFVYEERDFACLRVLADALEDAGCPGGALLEHLREPGPHALGCWAVDTLLEKG